jgi:hypothetical protein
MILPKGIMDISKRRTVYRQIEEYRKRPLIVYATSTRQGLNAMMAPDVVREFIDQIDAIRSGDSVDVLINSTGGDALTAWKLMSLLRERFKTVSVLVPYMAFSAATIFALGADEIVMHPHASLGPIDPQIRMMQPDGKVRQFAYEDVGAFLEFLAEDVKLTEQLHLSDIVERLFHVVDPVNVGAAKRASKLSTDIGERLLSMHMNGDKTRARQIAENLNKSFFAHGDAVSRRRARELQLHIAPDDKNLEQLLWAAYCALETAMILREPFNPLHDYLKDPGAQASLTPLAPLTMPANTEPNIMQQVWQAAASQAIQRASNPAHKVPFSLFIAVCESERCASEVRSEGDLWAAILQGGDIKINVIERANGWKVVDRATAENVSSGNGTC